MEASARVVHLWQSLNTDVAHTLLPPHTVPYKRTRAAGSGALRGQRQSGGGGERGGSTHGGRDDPLLPPLTLALVAQERPRATPPRR